MELIETQCDPRIDAAGAKFGMTCGHVVGAFRYGHDPVHVEPS